MMGIIEGIMIQPMQDSLFLIIFIALLLDWWLGDMRFLHRNLLHPVEWFGRPAIFLEKIFNRGRPIYRFFAGLLVSVVLLHCSVFLARLIKLIWGFGVAKFGLADFYLLPIEIFFLAWMIAGRSLYQHVFAVYQDRDDLTKARRALSHIVGRKTENLEKRAISAAAIETLAENFSDGVIAPLFYYCLFGLEGLFFYKCLNTLDSLYGYRDKHYQYFGKFAARLDDIANLIPARLCCFVVFLSGLFYAPARVFSKSGWYGLWGKTPFLWHYVTSKNAAEMASPNAIWSEWAFAQILNLKLGGLREYAGGITQKNEVGIGKDNIQFSDICAALSLYRHVFLLLLLLTGIFAILTFILAN